MKQKRILNIGCGKDTYGTDFVDLYPSRKEVIRCNVDKQRLPFVNNTFNEVYSGNVFEHLTNPPHFLKEISRVLKNSGKIVLITDNAGCLYFHFKSLGYFHTVHYGGHEGEGKLDKHYALFTPEHLKNWLKLAGFKKIRINYRILCSKTLGGVIKKIFTKISKKHFSLNLKAIAFK